MSACSELFQRLLLGQVPDSTQETLYGGESTSSQATAERQGKKIATGQQALIPMVKSFVKIENPEQTRRWVS